MAVANGAPAVVFGAVWREGGTLLRAADYSDLRSGRLVSTDTVFLLPTGQLPPLF